MLAVPIAPLDDSNGAVVYEDVVAWLHRYKALLTARDSVMVLTELLNAHMHTAGLRWKFLGCRAPIPLVAPAVPTTVRSSAMLTGWYGSLASLTCTEAEKLKTGEWTHLRKSSGSDSIDIPATCAPQRHRRRQAKHLLHDANLRVSRHLCTVPRREAETRG